MHLINANVCYFLCRKNRNGGGGASSGWSSGGSGWNSGYDSYAEHGAHSQPVAQQIAYSGHHKVARR